MQQFQFSRATTVDQAVKAQAAAQTRFLAGGTNLIDMMKLDVERPSSLIDINALALSAIKPTPNGGLLLGALSRNSDVAQHPTVLRDYAVLSQAILSGASPQLRNMASTGGNLLQRTRCMYFRDPAFPCNKREPGSGCSAIEGVNRSLAILGTSKDCIATNPSDQNVALTALEATVHIQGPSGAREVPILNFYVVPGSTPHIETVLQPGDLITGVTLPPPRAGVRSVYLKLRDRAAYEFALASAAVLLGTQGNRITFARVALGGVGTKPWRSLEAERALEGHTVDLATFRHAAQEALRDAHPQSENGFKVDLAQRCIVRALTLATKSA
jgi:xanthine dehydrogenase YagS FAD-binding subunit